MRRPCYPHTRAYNNNKLQFLSKACTFLRYSSHHKGYKCINGKLFNSKDILIYEHIFPSLLEHNPAQCLVDTLYISF